MVNNLSVIGGKYRGTKIQSPLDSRTHPMGAREKNALFNRLNDQMQQSRVLDAYAGTGALAMEALSRGAREVTLVEKSAKIAKIARQNLQKLLPDKQVNIYIMSVMDFVLRFADEKFDIIIADPPYDQIDINEVSSLAKLLPVGGNLALSHPAKMSAPTLDDFTLVTSKTYAGAAISIYRKYGKIES